MTLMDFITGLFGGSGQTQATPQGVISTGGNTSPLGGLLGGGATAQTQMANQAAQSAQAAQAAQNAQVAKAATQQQQLQTPKQGDGFAQGIMKSLSGRDASGNLLQGQDRQNYMAGRAVAGFLSDLGRHIGGDTFGGRLAQGAYSQAVGGLEAMNSAIQQDFLNGIMQAYLNGTKPTTNTAKQIEETAGSVDKEVNQQLSEDSVNPVSPSADYLYKREMELQDFYRGMGL